MSSAGQIVGGIVGAVIGWFAGGPAGAVQGAALGSGIGAAIDPADLPDGPRLDDLKVQMSTYGAPIPFEWGTNRHAGTIIWPRVMEAVEHEQTESSKGGADQTTFTYTLTCAVLVCEGPIGGIRRIWANKKLIYDVTADQDAAVYDPAIGRLRFYLGTETQNADPLIEAMDGPSPAYRGYAYVVFEDYDVTEMSGRPPQWEFEVISNIDSDFSPELTLLDEIPAGTLGKANYKMGYDTDRGTLWVHNGDNLSTAAETGGANDSSCINVYDVAGRTRLAIISPGQDRNFGDLSYADSLQHMYAGGDYIDSLGNLDTNGATAFDPVELEIAAAVLRSTTSLGATWPERPGRIEYIGSDGFLAATASSHVGSGICLWAPGLGAYARTDDLEGFWKTQALMLSNGQIAVVSDSSVEEGGVLTITPTPAFFYNFHPKSSFGNVQPVHVAEDTSRERMLVCAGALAWYVPVDGGTPLQFFDAEGSEVTVCSMYDPRSDKIYVITVASGVRKLYIVNAENFDVNQTFSLAGMGDTPVEMMLSPVGGEIIIKGQTSVWLLSDLYASLTPGQVPLSTIVGDICRRTGLTSGDIDVTELTDGVDGYVVTRQMTARAALEPLQGAFFFDTVESDDKIKFVKRNNTTTTAIPMDDRAAHAFGDSMPDHLSIMRAFELELPYECMVEYPDLESDHLIGTQYDRRLTKASRQKITLALAIVMTGERAKIIARTVLYQAWLNLSFRFTTTRKYAYLEPTDLVLLPTEAATYTSRLIRKTEQPNGVIEWEAQITALDVYDQTGDDATPNNYVPQSVYNPGDTILQLLDMPMLRDADDNAGFYVAMAGTEDGWRGAQLYRSRDSGANYEPIFGIAEETAIGVATTVLPDFTAGNIFDEGSTVTVSLRSGSLISVTEDQVLNGYNTAILGAHGRWEVIQFKNAELVAVDTYELSGFLRGRRGTEWATATHEDGDTFVFASITAWNRLNGSDTGLARLYKAPPSRVRLEAVDAQEFTNSSVGLKPFSPVDAEGERDGSSNLTITWLRRTRLIAGTLHLPVLLGETTEAYEIDVMDGDDVLRTIDATATTATYLASEQTADGLTPGDPVTVRIYQMSAAVGRGTPLEVTL